MLATSSGSGLPRIIIVEDMVVPGHSDQTLNIIHSIQVGPSWMDPLVLFLRNGSHPKTKVRLRRFEEKLHNIGFSRSRSCTNTPTQDHIYYVSILKL